MTQYQRIDVRRAGDVPVAAADYWRVLLDWDKIPLWMPTDPAPVPIDRVEIAAGHRLGSLPCTRNVFFDLNRLPPGVPKEILPELVPETLLHVDEVARFIYYNMEGVGPFGMRNYLATTTVDERGPSLSYVTCSGRFDLPVGVPPESVSGFIGAVYDGIIHGIGAYINRLSR